MPPGGERAPHPSDDERARANAVEQQSRTAHVRIRPHQHPHAEQESQPETHPGRGDAARPAGDGGCGARGGHTALRRSGGVPAAESGVRLGKLREQLVHLAHLAIPVPFFLFVDHYPPPSPRARPYRSIFLYKLLRGICNVRAVSDTFQSCSCNLRSRKARSAACLNSSNVAARSQVASPSRLPPPLPPPMPFPVPASPLPTSFSTSLGVTVGPAARMSRRSTAFLSSRMLPGQSCAVSRSTAAVSNSFAGNPTCVNSAVKWATSCGMSLRRSRSEGT